jgi:protein gp37
MSDRTSIEWTDASWNPIRFEGPKGTGWHCEHVSEGCRNCYAEIFNRRLGTGLDYKPGNRRRIVGFVDEKALLQPLKWHKPRKIFVCSMTDLFADFVSDEMIDRVFAVMALCPQHVFQVLTKRPERMRRYLADPMTEERIRFARDLQRQSGGQIIELLTTLLPLPNVWLGVSAEDQAAADERIPLLLDTPAAVRWLSCEPLLGPVNIGNIDLGDRSIYPLIGRKAVDRPKEDCDVLPTGKIDWVVTGGESGPGARPMHPDWARSLRDQCAAAGVPFLFKQWGEWAPDDGEGGLDKLDKVIGARALNWADGAWHALPKLLSEREIGDDDVYRLGKKAAGRLLDGVRHDGYPA